MRRRGLAAALAATAALASMPLPEAARRAPAPEVWAHDLRVSFELVQGTLRVTDVVTVGAGPGTRPGAPPRPARAPLLFSLASSLRLTSVRINGVDRLDAVVSAGEGSRPGLGLFAGPEVSAADQVELAYEGRVGSPELPAITPEWAALEPGDGWVPAFGDAPAVYGLAVQTPAGWTVVSQGDAGGSAGEATVRSAIPAEGLTIVAGRFTRAAIAHRGVDLAVLTLDENAARTESLLRDAAHGLDRLVSLLGPYPWPKLDLVESPRALPERARPSLILLEPGAQGPSARHALAEALAAQWWGALVMPADPRLDWTAGLAALFALPDDPDGAARGRAEMALRAQDSASPEAPDAAAGRLGLTFAQLRRVLGEEAFARGARRLMESARGRRAGWDDVRAAFEAEAARDLRWFFTQWREPAALPRLALRDLRVERHGAETRLTGRVTQDPPDWRLMVPLAITTLQEGAGPEPSLLVETHGESTPFSIDFATRPVEVRLDPATELPRHQGAGGPASLAETLRAERKLYVLPAGLFGQADHPYVRLARMAVSLHGGTVVSDDELRDEDLPGRSLFVLGAPWENRVAGRLARGFAPFLRASRTGIRTPGGGCEGRECAVLMSVRHPGDGARTVTVFFGLSPEALGRAQHALRHRRASWTLFRAGEPVAEGIEPVAGADTQAWLIRPPVDEAPPAGGPPMAPAGPDGTAAPQVFTTQLIDASSARGASVHLVRGADDSTFAARPFPVPASSTRLEPAAGAILVEPEDLAALGSHPPPANLPHFEGSLILTLERPAEESSPLTLAELIQGAARLQARGLILIRAGEGRSVHESVLAAPPGDPLALIPFAGPAPDLLVLSAGPELGAELLGRHAFARLATPPGQSGVAARFSPWLLDLLAGAQAQVGRVEGGGTNQIMRLDGADPALRGEAVLVLSLARPDHPAPAAWLAACAGALRGQARAPARGVVLALLDPAHAGRPAAAALAAWLDAEGVSPIAAIEVAMEPGVPGDDGLLEATVASASMERLARGVAQMSGLALFAAAAKRPVAWDTSTQMLPAALAPWARRGVPVMRISSTGSGGDAEDSTGAGASVRAVAALAAALAQP